MVDFLRFSSKFRQNRQFRILEKRRERSYTPGDVEYTQGLPMKKSVTNRNQQKVFKNRLEKIFWPFFSKKFVILKNSQNKYHLLKKDRKTPLFSKK